MRFLSFPLNNFNNCDIFYEYIKKLHHSIFPNIKKNKILNNFKFNCYQKTVRIIKCLYFFNNDDTKVIIRKY